MPSQIQRIKGLSASLDHLEDRVKAYRAALTTTVSGQLQSSEVGDVAVADAEIETVESVIFQTAKTVIDSDPYETGWESFQSFRSRHRMQAIDKLTEDIQCALQWIRISRVFIAYLTGIASQEAAQSSPTEASTADGAEIPSSSGTSGLSTPFGQYFGDLELKPLTDGRKMKLLKPFGFLDARNKRWPVPAGTEVDGASIPQPLWTIMGGPFEGKYRDASVVHDYYCSARLRPWREVHRLFYEAMRASDVSQSRAKLMYAAVYFGGPRWSEMDSINTSLPRIDEKGNLFSVQTSRFEAAAYATIEVGGESVAAFVKTGNFRMPSGLESRLHLDQAEQVIQDYDPSLSEIERAIDNAVAISADLAGNRARILVTPPSQASPTASDIISFQDPSVEALIRIEVNKPDGTITRTDMEGITGLDFRDHPVSDLTDLRSCINLRILSLEGAPVHDLSPLVALNTLETLSINRTEVTDLSPLMSLRALRELHMGKTKITDISPLAALVELRMVSLAYSPVTDIQALLHLAISGGLKKGNVNLWGVPLSWDARNVQVPMLASLDVDVSA